MKIILKGITSSNYKRLAKVGAFYFEGRRFARNTLDCLNFVIMLKDLGIGVIFEKENISTLDSKGEVLLTILSSLAQDESRSISEKSTWGIRRKFEHGKKKSIC